MAKWVRRAVSGIGAVAMALTAQAASAETLILTSINAPAHWSEVEGHVPFMACVKEGTKGGIDFNYFNSSSLATVPTALDVLNKGTAQISFVATFAVSDKMPINNIPLLPGMGDNVLQIVHAYRKVVDDPKSPYAQELDKVGVVPLILNVFPAYQVMSGKAM